jgi:hypothetical protein
MLRNVKRALVDAIIVFGEGSGILSPARWTAAIKKAPKRPFYQRRVTDPLGFYATM